MQSKHVSLKFQQAWLACYPWPRWCVHDNGSEFIGESFVRLLEQTGIKDVAITACNPQSNAICETMHQTVGNILRTLLYTHPPTDVEQAQDLVDEALSTASHALRMAVTRLLGASPGAITFGRDMLLDIPVIADWQLIRDKRQVLINENLCRQNQQR